MKIINILREEFNSEKIKFVKAQDYEDAAHFRDLEKEMINSTNNNDAINIIKNSIQDTFFEKYKEIKIKILHKAQKELRQEKLNKINESRR